MNDQQRTRLAILGTSGLLFGCGILGWVWYKNEKQKEAEMNEPTLAPYVRIASRKPANGITTSSTGTVKVAINTAPGSSAGSGTTTPAMSVKPGSVGLTPPKPGQPAATIAPAVTVKAGTDSAPPTATKPPSPIVVAGKPTMPPQPIVVAGKPTMPPAPTVPVVKPGLPPAPSVAIKPGPVPAPHTVAMAKPGQPILPPANVTAAVKPVQPLPTTAAAIKPAMPLAKPNFPNGPKLAPPGTQGSVPIAGAPSVILPPTPIAPPKRGLVPAITHAEASANAHREIGRYDPMQALAAYLPFPRTSAPIGKSTALSSKDTNLVPPPPPSEGDEPTIADKEIKSEKASSKKGKVQIAKKPAGELVPPPPPSEITNIDDLAGIQLPPPPDKPRISDKLQVISIMDDRAIIAFPSDMRLKNHWPKTISLGVGEQFDSVKIVGVSPNGITVEEDGERSLREVPNIK